MQLLRRKKVPAKAIGLKKEELYLAKSGNTAKLFVMVDGIIYEMDLFAQMSGGFTLGDPQYIVSTAHSAIPNADVLTGTSNEITVTNGSGSSTLSTQLSIEYAMALA